MRDADDYMPKSDFLALAAAGDIPFAGSAAAAGNLAMLIDLTRDADVSNRDWATMLLGMHGPVTNEVWSALLIAARDENCDVRAEALEGLARRDRALVLSLIAAELSKPVCGYGAFVAANIAADASLLHLLEKFDTEAAGDHVDHIRDAMEACRTGISSELEKPTGKPGPETHQG